MPIRRRTRWSQWWRAHRRAPSPSGGAHAPSSATPQSRHSQRPVRGRSGYPICRPRASTSEWWRDGRRRAGGGRVGGRVLALSFALIGCRRRGRRGARPPRGCRTAPPGAAVLSHPAGDELAVRMSTLCCGRFVRALARLAVCAGSQRCRGAGLLCGLLCTAAEAVSLRGMSNRAAASEKAVLWGREGRRRRNAAGWTAAHQVRPRLNVGAPQNKLSSTMASEPFMPACTSSEGRSRASLPRGAGTHTGQPARSWTVRG